MSIKVVVLYTQPADPAAFDQHYFDVHAPLVRNIPGLERFETSKLAAALDGGEATYYRMAELYFADGEAMGRAMSGPEGQATNADYAAIAPEGSRIYLAEVD
jgi:uncharacterized protein (TIGR02118 family)